jgi:hypothetical protein
MSPPARSLESIRNNHRNSRPHLDPETEQNRVYKQLQRGTSFRCSFSSVKPGLLCGKWRCPACRLRLSARWMRSAGDLLDDAHERGECSYKLVAAHPDAQHFDEARRRFQRFQRLLRKRHPGCRVAWSLGISNKGKLHRHVLVAGPVSWRALVDLLVEVELLDAGDEPGLRYAVQEVGGTAQERVHAAAYAAANGSAYAAVHAPFVSHVRPFSSRRS